MSLENCFKVVEYSDVYQFDQDTREYLTMDESQNNLVLGVIKILCDPAQEYFTSYYMLTVVHGNELCLVAVWTPIYNLVLSVVQLPTTTATSDISALDKESLLLKIMMFQALQKSMLSKSRIITGMFAQKDDATLFAALWKKHYLKYMAQPMSITTKMSEKLYELKPIDLKVDCPQEQYEMKQQQQETTEVTMLGSGNTALAQASNTTRSPSQPNSHLIIEGMSSNDFETCLDWMVHFQQESGFYSSVPKDLIRKLNKSRLDLLVKTECIYTLRNLETGKIVSMSAVNAETPNGGRVGWVYTPIEHRGKGYSQVCVSRMCDRVFKEKRKQKMFLFADKANTAANHLYRKIGFREVCDVDNLSFLYDELLKSNL